MKKQQQNIAPTEKQLKKNLDFQNKTDKLTNNTLSYIIRKFENHSSIMKIKENSKKNFLLLPSDCFQSILPKHQCGFRKVYSAQNCLLVMVEKWKKCLDIKTFQALLTDLPKAFNYIPHKLSLAKLNVQSNLSIEDMLYSGHLVVADTFQWNRLNHGQNLIEKPLYSGHLCSGQLLQRAQFKFTTLLQRTTHIFLWKSINKLLFKCFYLTHFSTFLVLLSHFSVQ